MIFRPVNAILARSHGACPKWRFHAERGGADKQNERRVRLVAFLFGQAKQIGRMQTDLHDQRRGATFFGTGAALIAR